MGNTAIVIAVDISLSPSETYSTAHIAPAISANAVSDITITNSTVKEQANRYKENNEDSHFFVAFLAKKTDNVEKKAKNVVVSNCTFSGDIVNFSAPGASFTGLKGNGKIYKYVNTDTSGNAETIVVVDKTEKK